MCLALAANGAGVGKEEWEWEWEWEQEQEQQLELRRVLANRRPGSEEAGDSRPCEPVSCPVSSLYSLH